MLKIFRVFIFYSLWRLQKMFNDKNFSDYGTCFEDTEVDECFALVIAEPPIKTMVNTGIWE